MNLIDLPFVLFRIVIWIPRVLDPTGSSLQSTAVHAMRTCVRAGLMVHMGLRGQCLSLSDLPFVLLSIVF